MMMIYLVYRFFAASTTIMSQSQSQTQTLPQAGYGHNKVESMKQFDIVSTKCNASMRSLKFTRDMLKQIADNERRSSKLILSILDSTKSKQNKLQLPVNKIDESIQNYWKTVSKIHSNFASKITNHIVSIIDPFLNTNQTKLKRLIKKNKSTQNQFEEQKKEYNKHLESSLKAWKWLDDIIEENNRCIKQNRQPKDLKASQTTCGKAFERVINSTNKMNEIEIENHEQCCDVVEMLHESQVIRPKLLKMIVNNAYGDVETLAKLANESNIHCDIITSKDELLWKWVSYPKYHKEPLPCLPNQVFNKTERFTRFPQRKFPGPYQESTRLVLLEEIYKRKQLEQLKQENDKNINSEEKQDPETQQAKKQAEKQQDQHDSSRDSNSGTVNTKSELQAGQTIVSIPRAVSGHLMQECNQCKYKEAIVVAEKVEEKQMRFSAANGDTNSSNCNVNQGLNDSNPFSFNYQIFDKQMRVLDNRLNYNFKLINQDGDDNNFEFLISIKQLEKQLILHQQDITVK